MRFDETDGIRQIRQKYFGFYGHIKMRFIGIDIGLRNLALVILEVVDKKITNIQTELIDFGKKQTIQDILQARVLHAFFDEDYDGVFIERQSNRSSKCFALMSALYVGFLRGRMVPSHPNESISSTLKQDTNIVDPKNKFKVARELGLEIPDKIEDYKTRKKVAISLTRQVCTKLGISDITQGYRKKDDVSDAFLYAFFGILPKVDLSSFDKASKEFIEL